MSAARSSCYWCYRCNRYVRIWTGGDDSPVECSNCGGGFLSKFASIGTNNVSGGGDTSEMDLNEMEWYDQLPAAESFRTIEINDGHIAEESHCTVCKEAFESGNKVAETLCKHKYHLLCILQWLEHGNSCPLCRNKLLPDSPEARSFTGGRNTEPPVEMEDGIGRHIASEAVS